MIRGRGGRVGWACAGSVIVGCCALLLTACTGAPAPARTVTVTATPGPAPTVTVTATSTAAPVSLPPSVDDIAVLAYRSGSKAPGTQFTVPSSGYRISYLCLNDGRTDATAGLDASGGGDATSTRLVCDNAIHVITADAATVRENGRSGALRKLQITGDLQDVLGIDLVVRELS